MSTPYDPNKITYIGETDYRNKQVKFGIKSKDRTRHMYVIGKTGTGKSTLLQNMAVQDIQNGEGFAFIDPHGNLADALLDFIPKERIDDVVYFAPFDLANPVSFNVMEDIGPDKRHLVAAGLMSAFKKIWVDAWSARMEYILNNTILALLEYPNSTLLGINRMFADKEFRKEVVSHITDPGVKSFWEDEFASYTDKFAAEATPAIQNKVGQFTANPVIRNIIGQPKSTFNIREVMDQKKILIINLSKGQVGEDSANLLGSMLITKIYLAAMSRADLREQDLNKLPNFYLYVDEFQSFANESFADILSEARKYKLNLTVAHQYIEQMSEEVRAAVFGNVGTMITFRVGATDAEYLEKEYAPAFTAEDLVNLGFAQVYLKLMIDGMASAPFSARTLAPIPTPHISYRDVAIGRSREQFSRPRDVVEEEIIEWHKKNFQGNKEQGTGNREQGAMNKGRDGARQQRGGELKREDGPRGRRGDSPQRSDGQRQGGDRSRNGKIQESGNERPVRPPQTQTPAERETELRKVLSLDRLKAEQAPRRDANNKKKDPTPERLNDLKSALSALLGEQMEKVNKQPTTHNQQPTTTSSTNSGQATNNKEQGTRNKEQRIESKERRAENTEQPRTTDGAVKEVPREKLEEIFKED